MGSQIEFLAIWESLNNSDFKTPELEGFKNESGANRFSLSVKRWIEATNAKGILAKAGRYGGTYAHKDIAFEFGSWLSPTFKMYLIKEFQRLKESESNTLNIEWNFKRVVSKANYHLHTEAIKDFIVPKSNYSKDKEWIVYASEADLLNVSIFGCKAADWRAANPGLATKGYNIRDIASINQLVVLSNLESLNSLMIRSGMASKDRFEELSRISKQQLELFDKIDIEKSYKRVIEQNYSKLAESLPSAPTTHKSSPLKQAIQAMGEPLTDVNKKLNTPLNYNPKDDKK